MSRTVDVKLTALEVKALTEPKMHSIGNGLYLQVQRAGQRSWIHRFTLRSRTRDMGLGAYPAVSLAEARKGRDANRVLLARGIDPIEAKRAVQPGRRGGITFQEAAEGYIAAKRAEWSNAKHGQQWLNTLATYVYPVVGDKPAAEIDVGDMEAILKPIWVVKTVTATRVRERVEAILDSASVREKWSNYNNPATWRGQLSHILPSPSRIHEVRHHPALPFDKASAFIALLRQTSSTGARALEWTILTHARTKMTLYATWHEIDETARVWTVPADRMKGRKGKKRLHKIPLSDACMEILAQARPLRRPDQGDLIFPSPIKFGQPLSNATMAKTLKSHLDGDVDAVVHGFRATARTWAAEITEFHSDICEVALAHRLPGGPVRDAYDRGDLFAKRRGLMDDWAAYLAGRRPTK